MTMLITERCQLSLYSKQTGMLRPFHTYQLAGQTYGLDSGVIHQTNTGLFNRGKRKLKEMYYLSIVQQDKTLTLAFETRQIRTVWKGRLQPILDLGKLFLKFYF